MKDILSQYKRMIMNIKEEIKTIIDDYSFASAEANERNKYNGFFKGHRGTDSSWNHVKHPCLLRIKGLLASLKLINNKDNTYS
tara:strand:+ start:2360 stop:2608 length:249 start_codon:yes stop_codon:yes gene_type:complete